MDNINNNTTARFDNRRAKPLHLLPTDLPEAELRRIFNNVIYERGWTYYQHDSVFNAMKVADEMGNVVYLCASCKGTLRDYNFNNDVIFFCNCAGSSAPAYTVQLHRSAYGFNAAVCTCPAGTELLIEICMMREV